MGDLSSIAFRLLSPSTSDGAAIAVLELTAPTPGQLDAALLALGLPLLAVGAVRLTDLLGVDTGLAIRWSPQLVHLTPHGGPFIVRRLAAALAERGASPGADVAPRIAFPEARSLPEACALDALTRAASPCAIDVLLRQRDLWEQRRPAPPEAEPHVQAALDRLLNPPTVVLVGAPNIGKSSLANALAGRAVSIVADEPGVTRDHVGVMVELDGLVVRLIDAPGLAPATDPVSRAAFDLALEAIARCDLCLFCRDALQDFPDLSPHVPGPSLDPERTIRLGLRADLGPSPGAEASVSTVLPGGLAELPRLIRRRLLPDAALNTPLRWRFHPLLSPPGG